jgi:hypothetical protein
VYLAETLSQPTLVKVYSALSICSPTTVREDETLFTAVVRDENIKSTIIGRKKVLNIELSRSRSGNESDEECSSTPSLVALKVFKPGREMCEIAAKEYKLLRKLERSSQLPIIRAHSLS